MSQPHVGEIRIFAGNFAPAGWMKCQGQLLPIAEHDTLFNLIGTTYGGDGESTFALPDLSGRAPVHHGTGPTHGKTWQLAQTEGVESVNLTQNQIPQHSHPLVATAAAGTHAAAEGRMLAQGSSAEIYANTSATQDLSPSAAQQVGGSQPHTNMQPYVAVNYIISLYGVYPSPA